MAKRECASGHDLPAETVMGSAWDTSECAAAATLNLIADAGLRQVHES